jgi:hypothetical protein
MRTIAESMTRPPVQDLRPLDHPHWPAFVRLVKSGKLHPGLLEPRHFANHGLVIWETFLAGAAAEFELLTK